MTLVSTVRSSAVWVGLAALVLTTGGAARMGAQQEADSKRGASVPSQAATTASMVRKLVQREPIP
ncbi:MAG TPA: hypothetical protein VGS41_09245, partial [Chthonomonadales bacterium]|nr:hypothetical protein [Chthonomonadales bacterium]